MMTITVLTDMQNWKFMWQESWLLSFHNFLLCVDVRHPVVIIVIIIGISENQLNFIKGNINLLYLFLQHVLIIVLLSLLFLQNVEPQTSNFSFNYFKRHFKKESDNYSRNICRYRRLQEDHVIFPLPKVGDMM